MLAAAIRRLHLGEGHDDNNEADAYLLWRAAREAYGGPIAKVPAEQAGLHPTPHLAGREPQGRGVRPAGRSLVDEEAGPSVLLKKRRTCDRCGAYLRKDNTASLCDPCAVTVASCAPYIETATPQAPPDVNLLELIAGIMLTHDALHPGEPLYVRERLTSYGVDTDHVQIQQVARKLESRHGLILSGEPREPGYVVAAWKWVARRVRSSVRQR
jgi:hypothetical protein